MLPVYRLFLACTPHVSPQGFYLDEEPSHRCSISQRIKPQSSCRSYRQKNRFPGQPYMLVIVVIPPDMDWCDEGQIIPCCEFSQYKMGVILWVCGTVISLSVLKFHVLIFISSLCLFPTIFTPHQCSISKTPLVNLSPCLTLSLCQLICSVCHASPVLVPVPVLFFSWSSCVSLSHLPDICFQLLVPNSSSCFWFILLFSWNFAVFGLYFVFFWFLVVPWYVFCLVLPQYWILDLLHLDFVLKSMKLTFC